MFSVDIIVRRYAEAFISSASNTIGAERAADELKALKIIFRSNRDFEQFLYNPEIPYKEKCASVKNIMSSNFSQETIDFVCLLFEKGRISSLSDICDYARLKYLKGETMGALLSAAYPVDTKSLQFIKKRLEQKTGKKLNLYLGLNPELLGGIRIRLGNTILDGSVKRHLEDLREKLMRTQV